MGDIIIPNLEGFQWSDIRSGAKRCIEAIAPKATVHAEWKLEFDPATSLFKYVPAIMNGQSDHSGFVHAWMIGLASQNPNTSDSGTEIMVGGRTVDYNLEFALWGFFDYKSWRVAFGTNTVVNDSDSMTQNATAFAEAETRAVKAVFRTNPTLGLDSGRVRQCYPVPLSNSDNHAFSNGRQIIVSQNTLRVRVREAY